MMSLAAEKNNFIDSYDIGIYLYIIIFGDNTIFVNVFGVSEAMELNLCILYWFLNCHSS